MKEKYLVFFRSLSDAFRDVLMDILVVGFEMIEAQNNIPRVNLTAFLTLKPALSLLYCLANATNFAPSSQPGWIMA